MVYLGEYMSLVVEDVLQHARNIWRYRWLAVCISWAVAIVGWVTVIAWPNAYQAQARFYVDTIALRPLLQGGSVDQDIDAQLNFVRESLVGQSQLTRVAHDTGLDSMVKTPEERDALVASLRNAISIQSTAVPSAGAHDNQRASDSIYLINYRAATRERALAVVRSLLATLVQRTHNGDPDDIDVAQGFLRDQIDECEKRLAISESALAEFKKQNVALVPGARGDYFAQLQAEITATTKARSSLDMALRRREVLVHQLRGDSLPTKQSGVSSSGIRFGEPATFNDASVASAAGTDTSSRIAATQARLDELLLRYTERHPEVISAREELNKLKVRQTTEIAAVRNGDFSSVINSGLAANPVYQSTQVQLNQTDVEIATMRGELAEHERAANELHRIVNTAPAAEAEFSRLTRDNETIKAEYKALIERLDKTKTAENAAKNGAMQLHVIDQPSAPLAPVAPKKTLLVSSILLLAVAVGAGSAWLVSQLNPVFYKASALAEMTGLPVYGSVSSAWPERTRAEFKSQLLRVGWSSVGLFFMFIFSYVLILFFQRSSTGLLSKLFGAR